MTDDRPNALASDSAPLGEYEAAHPTTPAMVEQAQTAEKAPETEISLTQQLLERAEQVMREHECTEWQRQMRTPDVASCFFSFDDCEIEAAVSDTESVHGVESYFDLLRARKDTALKRLVLAILEHDGYEVRRTST
jgi:hypothetical protein